MIEFEYNEVEVQEYHDYQDNRSQAAKLLTKLKAKEAEGMGATKIFWRDQQATLVECSSRLYWESQLKKRGFTGRPEYPALPATQSYVRKPATWEAKLEAKNRRTYTLEETQTMNFKTSGHLPAHYYMDESVLEAYVESLTKEK
jgi:hypothetical protein